MILLVLTCLVANVLSAPSDVVSQAREIEEAVSQADALVRKQVLEGQAIPLQIVTGEIPLQAIPGGISLQSLTGGIPLQALTGALPLQGLTGAIPLQGLTAAIPLQGVTGGSQLLSTLLPSYLAPYLPSYLSQIPTGVLSQPQYPLSRLFRHAEAEHSHENKPTETNNKPSEQNSNPAEKELKEGNAKSK